MNLFTAIHVFLSSQKQSTRDSYEYVLRDMSRFVGDKPLDKVSIEHLAEYITELDSRNYASNYTWNKYVKTCRVFFNWCVKQGLIETSPARIMKLRRAERAVDRVRAMPDEDLQQILNYTQYRPRDHALVLFLADTGCRAGGAAGLKVDDIDWNQREAIVTEKGDKTRRVRFGEVCRYALQEWLRRRGKDAGPYVFGPKGQKIKASSVSQVLRRACRMVGVTPRGSHSLRHRKGFQFADGKENPRTAQQSLGHSDVKMTLDHYYPDDWERARKALDQYAIKPQQEEELNVIQFPKTKHS